MFWLPEPDGFEPEFQDEGSMDCAPACFVMACRWFGLDIHLDEMREYLGCSPDLGTDPDSLRAPLGMRLLEVVSVQQVYHHLRHPDPPRPVIANPVMTPCVLGYGSTALAPQHAVLVVGFGHGEVGFFDPLSLVLKNSPEAQVCDREAFEDAWIEGWALIPL